MKNSAAFKAMPHLLEESRETPIKRPSPIQSEKQFHREEMDPWKILRDAGLSGARPLI
jgi:hypothetical protein